ncbi:ankyrin repeat-containing domain protein [Aspergillus pseudoustus]|uniref:Ankyrin repeat-containing domain protein n=1 Tax=Aspergillus pseudoustus TaxID=1810923 RepID=A0ABR4J912_9EURO
MHFQSLPTELLLQIWSNLEEEADMNSLVLACARFHRVLNSILYKDAIETDAHGLAKWIGRTGQTQTLQHFITAGGDAVNNNRNTTTLFAAAKHGQKGIIRLLIDRGIDLEWKTEKGKAALGYAAREGHIELVRLFLDSGVPVDFRMEDGTTAIMYAAREGHNEIVELLLERGADPAAVDDWDRSVLRHAIDGDCAINLIELLLEKTTENLDDSDGYDGFPMGLAVERGNIPVVKFLLAAGASLDSGGREYTPLRMAIEACNEEMVRYLLDAGADANETPAQYAPLPLAASNGYHRIVDLLLERGADPLYVLPWGETPLIMAASKGYYRVVKRLLDAGVPPELEAERPHTALVSALVDGHDSIAVLLAERGALLDPPYDSKELTPLAWAIRNGNKKLVRLILEGGGNVQAEASHRMAPIIIAAMAGQADMVKLLLQHGADPRSENDQGCTPLAIAAQRGWFDVALALLDHERVNASPATVPVQATQVRHSSLSPPALATKSQDRLTIDKADTHGRTPLFHATANGYYNIVRALLSSGSGAMDTTTSAGRSPRSVVQQWFAQPELVVDDSAAAAEIQSMFHYADAGSTIPDNAIKGEEDDSATMALRRQTMHEFISVTPKLDIWTYLGYETLCHHCSTPINKYSEIFVCGQCEGGKWAACPECIARRDGQNEQRCLQAGDELRRLPPFQHPKKPGRERWVLLRERRFREINCQYSTPPTSDEE